MTTMSVDTLLGREEEMETIQALAVPQHIKCPRCNYPMFYSEWDSTIHCASMPCYGYNKKYTIEFPKIALTEVEVTQE